MAGKSKFVPTAAGVLVAGTRDGQPWMERCADHIYLTHEPKRNTKWQSGYQQGAICLICGTEVWPMDAGWWIERPTSKQLRIAGRIVKERIAELEEAYELFKAEFGKVRRQQR